MYLEGRAVACNDMRGPPPPPEKNALRLVHARAHIGAQRGLAGKREEGGTLTGREWLQVKHGYVYLIGIPHVNIKVLIIALGAQSSVEVSEGGGKDRK